MNLSDAASAIASASVDENRVVELTAIELTELDYLAWFLKNTITDFTLTIGPGPFTKLPSVAEQIITYEYRNSLENEEMTHHFILQVMRVSDGEVLMTMGPRVNLQQNVLINAANFVAMVWAKAYMNKHSFEEPEWKIAMVLLHPDNEETTRIETERELGQYFNNTFVEVVRELATAQIASQVILRKPELLVRLVNEINHVYGSNTTTIDEKRRQLEFLANPPCFYSATVTNEEAQATLDTTESTSAHGLLFPLAESNQNQVHQREDVNTASNEINEALSSIEHAIERHAKLIFLIIVLVVGISLEAQRRSTAVK